MRDAKSAPGRRSKRPTTRLLQALLIGTSLGSGGIALVFAPTAMAQEAVRQIDIPALPLGEALRRLGDQTGLQIGYSNADVAGLSAPAVSGPLQPRVALQRLLSGSGLSASFIGARTVSIMAKGEASPAGTTVPDGTVILDTIIIHGSPASGSGYRGTPDWVYETPGSISVISREAITTASPRDSKDLFAGVPGVIVSNDNAQSQGLNVNIRGLQDQTRITMMIDGARQNFQRSTHGSSGFTFVDPAFIRAAEIEKSGTSGVGGAASLGGAVNFRTLTGDDLIAPGATRGSEINLTTGTNAYHFAGSASTALRFSSKLTVLGGVSHKNVGTYEIGKHSPNYTDTALNSPEFIGAETASGFLKAEIRPTDDISLDLGWLHYSTEYAQGTDANVQDVNNVTNDTLTGDLHWNPGSDLIDLRARLWYNQVDDEEHRAFRTTSTPEAFVDYTMSGFGGSIENTSRFDLSFGNLAVNYGVEGFRDDGKTSATSSGISADPLEAWWYQGANGSGTRNVASAFVNATLDHEDWLTINGGLRYDYYRIKGATTIFSEEVTIQGECVLYRPNGTCRRYETVTIPQEAHETDVSLSGNEWSPTFGATFKPRDGIQIFARYAHTYRPPTVLEAAVGGTHIGGSSSGSGRFAPNPWLKPEEADTVEIGTNFSFDGVFRNNDSFRMKAVAFYREVDNYIAMGSIDLDEATNLTAFDSYVNLDGKTPMKGIELEANYDAGRYYVGASFSYLDADYATTYTYNGTSYLTSSYIMFVPPKTMFSLDAGVRVLEERLTLGGRVTYVGAADKNIGGVLSSSLVGSWQTGDYTLLDLYGSYELNERATLRFAVNNATDIAYVPAFGQSGYPAAGRTATISLNMKF